MSLSIPMHHPLMCREASYMKMPIRCDFLNPNRNHYVFTSCSTSSALVALIRFLHLIEVIHPFILTGIVLHSADTHDVAKERSDPVGTNRDTQRKI